ncbi:MAG: AMP-binding protein, partial [bacterium]|nr:AMP-binding protein [bacterium]
KAGGAYMPIDPAYPEERIRFMLADSNSEILATETVRSTAKIPFKLIEVDPTPAMVRSTPKIPLLRGVDRRRRDGVCPASHRRRAETAVCYTVYTSGSTGKPKGVLIEHRQVVRLLFNNRFPFFFDRNDRWTLFHSFCFDFSVWEMYGALLRGGSLVIVPKPITQDPHLFLKLLEKQQVTVLNQTPAAFYNLITETLPQPGKKIGLALRYVIFGGDSLNPLKLKPWKAAYPETKLINMYCITETTVHV